jgi:7-cyano-7-deazaguanine synthase in queuosine biosynthesis
MLAAHVESGATCPTLAELTPAQVAEHNRERKRLWEAKQIGGATCPTNDLRKDGRHKGPQHQKAFAADTAEKTGQDKRNINKAVARGEKIAPDVLPLLADNERAILEFSGGKDSTALLYLARPWLDRIVVYFADPGVTYPHVVEHVHRTCEALGAKLEVIKPPVTIEEWHEAEGLPSDIVPVESTAEMAWMMKDKAPQKLQPYTRCCAAMIWLPLQNAIKASGIKTVLRGSKACDARVGVADGYADLPDNSIVLLDKAYKNIGGSAAEATRAGNGEAARDLNSLRVQLRNAITGGDPNHPYAQALDAFSGPSASLDAVKAGQGVLDKDPAEISAEIRGLAPGDKEFYKLGAAQTLINNAETTGRTGNAVSRIAQSVRAQKQLKPLFDSDTDYDNFIAGINRANTRMETKTATIGNAATAGRLAEDEGGGASANPALAGAAEAAAGAMTGESIPVASGVWNMVKGLTTNGPPRSPAVNAAIAKMLFNPNQAEQQAIMQKIIAAQNRPQWSRAAAVPLASLAGAHPGVSLCYCSDTSGSPGASLPWGRGVT